MSSRAPKGQHLNRRLSVRFIAATLSIWVGYGQAAQDWPLVITAERSAACAQALSLGRQQVRTDGLRAPFSLLNWNVEKAQHPELISKFTAFAKKSDLIFLQEAVPLKKTQTVIEQSLF